MTTDSGLPAQVPIWQRSFLPEELPPAPPLPVPPPEMPTLAAPPPPATPPSALPAPTATPLSALPPPTGPAYGAPGSAVPAHPSGSANQPPYAAAPAAPAAPNRFGILPDPAYDAAAAPYGAGSWSPVGARPPIAMPVPTPQKVITAGRWGRARGVLVLVFGGMLLLASFAGSSGTGDDAFNGVLLILLSVFLLAWGLGWLVAGQRVIEGSRSAAQALRVLAFIDLGVVALSLASPDPTAWRGLLGAVLDVFIIATMFGNEASRWLSGRR